MEYASRGTAGAALGTGIAGLTLGVLNGAGGLLGMGNNFGWNRSYDCGSNGFVTHESLEYAMRLAQKESELAMVRAEQDAEVKMADIYERLITRINADAKSQADWNAAQAVYNATNSAGIGCLRNQVEELQRMTKMVIPADNVCPRPMDRYNNWVPPVNP